jgi:hypothetical protein
MKSFGGFQTPHSSLIIFQKMVDPILSQHFYSIHDLIHSGELSIVEMAQASDCNNSTISRISFNIKILGTFKAPLTKRSQLHSVTLVIPEALCNYLKEKPALYLDEMTIFLDEVFHKRNRATAAT